MTPELLASLKAAAALPEEQINRSDADAPFGTDWTGAVRGRLHRSATSRVVAHGGSDASFVVPARTNVPVDAEVRRAVPIFVDLRTTGSKVRVVDLRKYFFANNKKPILGAWRQ